MRVTVVSGPPCSGKSTYVAEHAEPGDVVVDVDLIAHAFGYPTEHLDWSDTEQHPARTAALIARASVLKAVRAGRIDGRVWVIDAAGRVVDELRGVLIDSMVDLDPGRDACLARARADGRPASTLEQIDRWFAARPGRVGATSQEW